MISLRSLFSKPPAAAKPILWGPGVYVAKGKGSKPILGAENLFIRMPQDMGVDIDLFTKRIATIENDEKEKGQKGNVVFMPGSWLDGNFFRAGIAEGYSFDDLDHDMSFANFLAIAGYDVWLPHILCERIEDRYVRRKLHAPFKLIPEDKLSFESIVKIILPALINYVESQSGGRPIYLIGHSLGGLEILAYQGIFHDPRIASLVPIAAPLRLGACEESTLVLTLTHMSFIYRLLGISRFQPPQLLSEFSIPLSKALAILARSANIWQLSDLVWNPENISRFTMDTIFRRCIEPMPLSLFSFIIELARTQRFEYDQQIKDISTPTLVVVGDKDRLVTLEAATCVHPKTYDLIIAHNAGHLDAVVGRKAKQEVWFPIMRFLNRQGEHYGNKTYRGPSRPKLRA